MRFSIAATGSILFLPCIIGLNPVSAQELRTQCTLEMASRDKFVFPCSVKYDPKLNMGVIKDLNSGRTYGKGWAEGRGCIYKDGYGSICTKGFKWVTPDGIL